MNDGKSSARATELRRVVAALVAIALVALIVWGFVEGRRESAREAARERPVQEPLRVSTVNGKPVITVDAATRRRSGIEIGTLKPAPYRGEARAYGTVLELTGLTELRNSYVNAKAQLQTAQAKLAASRTAYERARQLYEDEQTVSAAQFQSAEAAFRADEASAAAARSQSRTLTATAEQAWGAVLAAALVNDTSLIKRLIERRDFLLQVSLPPGTSLPQPPAEAAFQLGDDRRFPIRYVSPATRVDPRIQGASYFYLASAQSGVLPGMNLLAFLPYGEERTAARVPAEALVWWQDRAWIYQRTGPDRFSRVAIQAAAPAPGGGYLVEKPPPGTEIVVRGAQSLFSEEFRAQIRAGEEE